jgi:hypothetical protein
MTLSDFAVIGNIVSDVAVVASLVYLSLQVRQAEKNQRAIVHQTRVDRVTNTALAFSQPEMAKLLAKVAAPLTELSAEEVVRLLHCLRTQMVAFDDALWQHDAGLLDKIYFETTRLNTARMLANPAMRATWILLRPQIAPPLADRIERLVIRDMPLARPSDWAAAWKQAHTDVLAG